MLDQVDNTTTIIGLIFFFAVFIGVLIYVYRPSKKKDMEDHGNIPLNEPDNNESDNKEV